MTQPLSGALSIGAASRRQKCRPIVVGVAGGTGSGKTTVVEEILRGRAGSSVALIQNDFYYRDRSHLPGAERENVNYDHPDALETSLLIEHLEQWLAVRAVEVPLYDFATHIRRRERRRVEPCKRYADVIVPEGGHNWVAVEMRITKLRSIVEADAGQTPAPTSGDHGRLE